MASKILFNSNKYKQSKVLFLDRDGVINKRPKLHEYVCNYDNFIFNVGVFELINRAKELGFLVIVVTNQRGISRGLYSFDDFHKLTTLMQRDLVGHEAGVDAVYFCPHSIDSNCDCRKPKPGMFDDAIKDFGVDVASSIMIGDSNDDVLAAKDAGILTTYRIESDTLSELIDLFNR